MNIPQNASPHERLFLLLSRSATLLEKIIGEAIVSAGLTVAEYNFLSIVENHDKVTARDIQQMLSAAAPSVAQMVARLEKKGFLKRDKSGDDGRMMFLRLTFWGRRALKKARQSAEARVKKTRIAQKTLATLLAPLDALVSALSPEEEKAAKK